MPNNHRTMKAYTFACIYPNMLNVTEIETALNQYLEVLGAKRKVTQLKRSWSLNEHPSLAASADAILADLDRGRFNVIVQDTKNARDALSATVTRDATDFLQALDTTDAKNAQDAPITFTANTVLRGSSDAYLVSTATNIGLATIIARTKAASAVPASVTIGARDSAAARAAACATKTRAARITRDTSIANDTQHAMIARTNSNHTTTHALHDAGNAAHAFACWVVWQTSWYYNWDMSWLSSTYFGAKQLDSAEVMAWSGPLLDAFVAGAWGMYWTSDTLYWYAKPTAIHRDTVNRFHCQTGPAIENDLEDLYYWHGTPIPSDWIERRELLTAEIALGRTNTELRRTACEIVGWEKILASCNARIINTDTDPEIGALVEVQLEGRSERFLRVRCGTGRMFAIPVPPEMKTAMEAQAWTWALDLPEFLRPEIRT